MRTWQIEPLAATHQRSEFTCGKVLLDRFICTLVSQYQKRNLGRTYVAVRNGARRAYGYYTLAAAAVSFEN